MSDEKVGQVIRWGIIGAGNVAEFKSGPALMRAPDSAVAAVMRRDLVALPLFLWHLAHHAVGARYWL